MKNGTLLLVGDVHGDFELINRHLRHARALGVNVERVVQFGDLGVSQLNLGNYFLRAGRRFEAPVSFIDGNHEDFFFLGSVNRLFGEHLTHLERGTVHRLGPYRALCLGGAARMDPVNTPPPAIISNADIDRALAHRRDGVDVVFSHDSPCEARVPGSEELGYCGPTGFPRGQELLHRFQPRLWIFAHHHRWFDQTFEGTRFVGLDLAAKGYVLLGPEFSLIRVRHEAGLVPDRNAIYFDRPGRLPPLEGKSAAKVRAIARAVARLFSRRGRGSG